MIIPMLISTIVFKVCLAGYEFSLLDWLLCFDLVCFRLLDACHRLGLLVGYSMIHWLSRYQSFHCLTFDGLIDVFQSYCSYCLLTPLNSSCPFTPFSWLTFDPTYLCNSFQLWKFPVSSRFHPMHSRCILLLQSVSLLILCGFVGSTSNLVTSLPNPSTV